MIFVDCRAGSKELLKPLQDAGLNATSTTLSFGDVAFEGKSSSHATLDIGIEFKQLSELITCMHDGRFSGHQLPGLTGEHRMYDYAWLLYEGRWRTGSQGQLEIYKGMRRGKEIWVGAYGNITASEFKKRLMTFDICGGIRIKHTNMRQETLLFIEELYRWFTDKPLDGHSSHLAPHTVQSFIPLSDFRISVLTFPGIGIAASKAAEVYFTGSLVRATNATVQEWAELPVATKGKTKRLGMSTAQKVVDYCRGGK